MLVVIPGDVGLFEVPQAGNEDDEADEDEDDEADEDEDDEADEDEDDEDDD